MLCFHEIILVTTNWGTEEKKTRHQNSCLAIVGNHTSTFSVTKKNTVIIKFNILSGISLFGIVRISNPVNVLMLDCHMCSKTIC